MTDNGPIENEVIDQYRAERAPRHFLANVTATATGEEKRRTAPKIGWAIAATAAIALAVLVLTFESRPPAATRPSVALSFSELPAGLPTLSQIRSPTVSELRGISSITGARTFSVRVPSMSTIRMPTSSTAKSISPLPN